MGDVLITGIHRMRRAGAVGASWQTGEDISEYRVLANRARRAYLAIVTVRAASEIAVAHGPSKVTDPTVAQIIICRVGSEREITGGRCRDELGAAVGAAVLAEHLRRAAA